MLEAKGPVANAARELLRAAHEFRKAKQSAGLYGAVHWVDFENGEIVIFTRGEYRDQLMQNIDPKWPVEHFAPVPEEQAPGGGS